MTTTHDTEWAMRAARLEEGFAVAAGTPLTPQNLLGQESTAPRHDQHVAESKLAFVVARLSTQIEFGQTTVRKLVERQASLVGNVIGVGVALLLLFCVVAITAVSKVEHLKDDNKALRDELNELRERVTKLEAGKTR